MITYKTRKPRGIRARYTNVHGGPYDMFVHAKSLVSKSGAKSIMIIFWSCEALCSIVSESSVGRVTESNRVTNLTILPTLALTSKMCESCAFLNSLTHLAAPGPPFRSHTLILRSYDALMRRIVPGSKDSARTSCSWPVRVWTHSPVEADQILIFLSFEPEIMRSPRNSMHANPRSWPSKVRKRSPVGMSQSMILPSPDALTTLSSWSPTALTGPSCPDNVWKGWRLARSQTRMWVSLELWKQSNKPYSQCNDGNGLPAHDPLLINFQIQDAPCVAPQLSNMLPLKLPGFIDTDIPNHHPLVAAP